MRSSTIARRLIWFRRHGAVVLGEVAANFALPVLVYDRVAPRHGDVVALVVSSGPPILWSLVEFLRRRRLDAISAVVLAGIALSLAAIVGGGSARFLQLRENLVSALVGLVFLASAAAGRPLIYHFAHAGLGRASPERAAAFAARRDTPLVRRTATVMSLVWGIGLLASAAFACLLVLTLSIHDYLIVQPVAGYGTMGAMVVWTFWYGRRAARKAEGQAGPDR